MLFPGSPKRVAVLYEANDRLRDLLFKIGLAEICISTHQSCVLESAPEASRIWTHLDEVDCVHGSSFTLTFQQKEDICQTPIVHEMDHAHLMQVSVPRLGRWTYRIADYLRRFPQSDGVLYVWLHDSHRQHDFCTNFRRYGRSSQQDDMAWLRVFNLQEMQGEGTSFVEIDPPPVYRNLPRPHLIVFRSTARSITPVLVEATFRETVLLGSMLLWSESGSFQVETLFNLALPGHDCRGMSDCYAIVRGWNLLVSHDVVLFSGDFIRISEWPNTPDSLADDSTCLDSLATTLSEPDMADSWSSTPSTQERAEIASDRALSNDGDNTATPLWDLHVGATETPEPAQDDTLSLFQPILQQRDTSLGSPVMTRPPEDMQGEVQQAWLWGRSVELTRRSTKIWGFDTLRQRLWPIKRPEGFGPMSY